jgi:hypothetical protein
MARFVEIEGEVTGGKFMLVSINRSGDEYFWLANRAEYHRDVLATFTRKHKLMSEDMKLHGGGFIDFDQERKKSVFSNRHQCSTEHVIRKCCSGFCVRVEHTLGTLYIFIECQAR